MITKYNLYCYTVTPSIYIPTVVLKLEHALDLTRFAKTQVDGPQPQRVSETRCGMESEN